MGIRVHQTASTKDRSITPSEVPISGLTADPVLLFWRRILDSTVADACKTLHGQPTDAAILARWWIEDDRPTQADKYAWMGSFEATCGWLHLDAATERVRLVAAIDAALADAARKYSTERMLYRKAAVLTCAGIPTDCHGRSVLPLVSEHDYDDVAGVDRPDPTHAKMPQHRSI